jgi:hypothetical protein
MKTGKPYTEINILKANAAVLVSSARDVHNPTTLIDPTIPHKQIGKQKVSKVSNSELGFKSVSRNGIGTSHNSSAVDQNIDMSISAYDIRSCLAHRREGTKIHGQNFDLYGWILRCDLLSNRSRSID